MQYFFLLGISEFKLNNIYILKIPDTFPKTVLCLIIAKLDHGLETLSYISPWRACSGWTILIHRCIIAKYNKWIKKSKIKWVK